MGAEQFLSAAGTAAITGGAVWFYLHCIRPAFRWHRARWTSHVLLGIVSLLPAAAVVVVPDSRPLQLVGALSFTALALAWMFPRPTVRATGGQATKTRGIDVVIGWLSPAAEQLDVGNLAAAQGQVDEARKHATLETLPYVDLWDAMVRDEERRRRGERVSRIVRLKAIEEEYARLILGDEPMRPTVEAIAGLGVAALVLASIVGG